MNAAEAVARHAAELVYGVDLDALDTARMDDLLSLLLKSAFLVGKRFDDLFYDQLEDGIDQLEAWLTWADAGGVSLDGGRS